MTDWVGIPFLLGGRSREGMDCVGLVLARLAAAGFSLDDPWTRLAPTIGVIEADASRHMPEPWVPVLPGGERELDVSVMWHQGVPCHVGVLEHQGLVLHTSEHTGSILSRFAALRRAKLIHSVWRPQ